MSLVKSFRSELLKTKRTASFYLTLIGAVIGPVIFLLNVLVDESDVEATTGNPLNDHFKMLSETNGVAFFPLFIILICTLLPQIEYRNNTWKQVFASPQTKLNVFLSKLLNVHLLMITFLVLTHVFMFLSLAALNLIKPDLNLFDHPLDGRTVLLNAFNSYILALALGSVQLWMGLRFKNFIIPIGVGLAFWFGGIIMALKDKPLAYFFPYSFQTLPVAENLQPHLTQLSLTSLMLALLFLLFAFLDFRRRTIKMAT